MGGSQSAPAMQYVVREEPYPAALGADGLSLSQAEKCNACQLGVNTKITTSNVKLKRQSGTITPAQCKRYSEDMTRVQNKTLSVGDFVGRLRNGDYSQLVSDSKSDSDQYCQELSISDEDAVAMRESGTMDTSKFKKGRIQKVSGASFSEETKAKFIPSIPFQMDFTARKAAMEKGKIVYKGVSESFTVTQMTLYHPAPIRIDSVQADAMLSLNDPSDPAAKYIVLIPLKAANSGTPSTSFFSKIAPRLFDVKEARPDTGEYQETTIATGADWALDKLFTLAEKTGSSVVKNGFFTWTGVAGYERYNKGVSFEGRTHVTNIGWRQTAGLSAPQYILLDTPLDINPEDMAVLTQSLPTTPPAEAIHTVPAQTNLIYHKASEPPAPDSISGKQTCGSGDICEGFTTGIARETFEGCPGARCDPFLQNVAKISGQDSVFTPERMFAFFFGFMTVIAMMIGAYIALILVRDDYDFRLRNFSEQAGQALAVWYKQAAEKIKGLGNLVKMARGGIGANLTQTATAAATNAASGAANKATGAVTNQLANVANTATGAVTNQLANVANTATGAVTNQLTNVANPLTKGKSLLSKFRR